jgi:hypothetical protein
MNFKRIPAVINAIDHLMMVREEVARKKAAGDHEKLPESRFRFLVRAISEEGGAFSYENAYAFWIDDWFCVVAEHCPAEAYHRDELLWWGIYARQEEPNFTDTYDDLLNMEATL